MTTLQNLDLRPEVLAGIAWLDENGPEDWIDKVNLLDLNMYRFDYCLLAQLSNGGQWQDGLDEFGLSHGTAYRLGFNDDRIISPKNLTDEWKRAIKHLRGEE